MTSSVSPRPYSAVNNYTFVSAFAQIRILNCRNRILVCATGNNCVESTSILHRTTESERGLMAGGIYNYLTIKNKHINLSFFS